MIERCHLIGAEIQSLEYISPANVSRAIQNMGSLRVTRLIIADNNGVAIFDSLDTASSVGNIVLLPEIVEALNGNDVFASTYQNGTMFSRAATPIMSYGTLLGCVYMTEYDPTQGAILKSIQNVVLTITMYLEIAVIFFSFILSRAFSRRMNNLIDSMNIIREGEYSHQVEIGGHDEISVLGKEFNGLVSRLQDMDEARKQFVSNASHELKTPLASIKLLSDSILQNEMDMQTVREFVSDIGNEADRLNRMTQNLLTLSKADAKLLQDYEIIQISDTVTLAVRTLTPFAEIHQVSIHTELSEHCPVLTSEDDMIQIVFNLISNGIKYNKPNGTLYITLARQDDMAVLTVKDEGIGIPEDSLPYIFDRFYRVDKARSRSTGGSGLGLSIVRDLVNRHNGEISVESTVGVGTVFTLKLPVFDTEDAQ